MTHIDELFTMNATIFHKKITIVIINITGTLTFDVNVIITISVVNQLNSKRHTILQMYWLYL